MGAAGVSVPARAGERGVAAGRRAGFGSEPIYRRAKRVVEEGVPELVEAMDRADVTIRAGAVEV